MASARRERKIADFLNKKLTVIGNFIDNNKSHGNELKGEIFGFKSQISQFEEYKSALITAVVSENRRPRLPTPGGHCMTISKTMADLKKARVFTQNRTRV